MYFYNEIDCFVVSIVLFFIPLIVCLAMIKNRFFENGPNLILL
jgi:hypothetical protein